LAVSRDFDAAASDPAMTDSLLKAIDAHLARRSVLLRFGARLEQRFEADTGSRRKRHLLAAGLVTLVIYDLFLCNDYLIRRSAVPVAAFLRLGVLTPLALLILWQLRRGLRPALREGLMTCAVFIAMTVSCAIFAFADDGHAIFDPFSFSLIVLGGNVVFSLRFPYALAATLGSLAIMAGFLHGAAMPADLRLFALMVAGATGVFTLAANYRLEASERRSYLLLLRETLRNSSMAQDNQALTRISYTDPLTGVANRRHFDETLARRWNEALVAGTRLGLLMIDIDHFKAYNDCHGHPAGDRCLCQVAELIRHQVRTDLDLVARLGGEEFAVLLPGTHSTAAYQAAERICDAVEAAAIAHRGVPNQETVTVSVGVAVIEPYETGQPADLIGMADRALYAAKRNGRNQAQLAAA
jgi:diguanylate cyclase (GGDEF)-like protein